MSSLTSVTGLLPLILAPGAGSELYRGLGAVVAGGLFVSTFFTIVLVPLVLAVFTRRGDQVSPSSVA
jgi:HAE1 family hydrophobic/amphiphilic exporter-1